VSLGRTAFILSFPLTLRKRERERGTSPWYPSTRLSSSLALKHSESVTISYRHSRKGSFLSSALERHSFSERTALAGKLLHTPWRSVNLHDHRPAIISNPLP